MFYKFIIYLLLYIGEALPYNILVKLWIIKGYYLYKEAVKRELSTAISKIYILRSEERRVGKECQ